MKYVADLIGTLAGHGWTEIEGFEDARCFVRNEFKINVFSNTGTLSLINRISASLDDRYIMTTDSMSSLFDITVTQEEFMDTVCGKPSGTGMRIKNLKNLRILEAL